MTSGTTNTADAATCDLAHFDGSCEPNPGGRIGLGWIVQYADGQAESDSEERAPATANTNNQAEYLALIALLTNYVRYGGKGPLVVRGDSQLIIQQMRGAWGVNDPTLATLYANATALARTVAGGVTYQWVRREHNVVADLLSRPRATTAPAPTDAATGRLVPHASTAVYQAEQAMGRAWWDFTMAEQRNQPAQVLERMEAKYFAALARYEAALVEAVPR